MDGSSFRELVSGRRRGLAASGLRTVLSLLEIPYSIAVGMRNTLYDCRIFPTKRFVEVPTISVGNLTLGGTGKTPLVAWIAELLLAQGRRPGLISRGYGGEGRQPKACYRRDRKPAPVGRWYCEKDSQSSRSAIPEFAPDHGLPDTYDRFAGWNALNDEGRELALRLPGVPHVQNPDRIAAAKELLGMIPKPDCLLLDDAFQHRRIGRDLDIVLLDALEPFGFEHVFPRGTLRESLKGLCRADIILLSRADLLDGTRRNEIKNRLRRLASDALYAEIAHVPKSLLALGFADGCAGAVADEPLDTLRDRAVFAFCGIGNPSGFSKTLQGCGARITGFRAFPDHHVYTATEIDALAAQAKEAGAGMIVCTVKDLVKIGQKTLADIPLRAVAIGIEFTDPDEEQTVLKTVNVKCEKGSRAEADTATG